MLLWKISIVRSEIYHILAKILKIIVFSKSCMLKNLIGAILTPQSPMDSLRVPLNHQHM